MSYKYNSSRVSEIMRDEISPLKDLCEIEDLMAKIKEIDKNILFYKNQKKSRTKILNEEIKDLEDSKNKLKSIIKVTLDDHEEDSLSFPQVGVVKKKSGSSTWVIKDEEALISKLKASLTEEELEGVVVSQPKISKKSVDALLSEWKSGGTWPDGVEDLVELQVSPDNIAISLDKGLNPKPEVKSNPQENVTQAVSPEFFEEHHAVDESKSLDDVLGEISEEDL